MSATSTSLALDPKTGNPNLNTTMPDDEFDNLLKMPFKKFKKTLNTKKLNLNAQEKEISLLFKISPMKTQCLDYNKKMRFLYNEYGGDVNLINISESHKNTMLHTLLMNEEREEALEFFELASHTNRKNLLDPNIKDVNGRTILMLAIIIGFDEFIKRLINHRARLDLRLDEVDNIKFSAFHLACILRNGTAVELLITHGAKRRLQDTWQRVATQYLETDFPYLKGSKGLMDSMTMNIERAKNAPNNTVQGSGSLLKNSLDGLITKSSHDNIAREISTYLRSKSMKLDKTQLFNVMLNMFFHNLQKHGIVASKVKMNIKRAELMSFNKEAIQAQACTDEQWKEFVDFRESLSRTSLEEHILSPARRNILLQYAIYHPNRAAIKAMLMLPQYAQFSSTEADVVASYLEVDLQKELEAVESSEEASKSDKKDGPILFRYHTKYGVLAGASSSAEITTPRTTAATPDAKASTAIPATTAVILL